MAHHTLTLRERFLVSNYILNHSGELRALPSNNERIRHLEEALGMRLTQSNMDNAAKAAGVSLSAPPEKKASVTELRKLVGELLQRVEELERVQRSPFIGTVPHNDQPHLL